MTVVRTEKKVGKFDQGGICFKRLILEVLDLAPVGLLSILKFDMGAYSRECLFEGRGLIEKFCTLHVAIFETTCFLHATISLG